MRANLRYFGMLLLFIFQFSFFVPAQPALPPLTDSIDSKILNETRGIQVKLPGDYKAGSNEKYEVVYILDGEWYHELVPFTYGFAHSANYIPKAVFVLIRNRYVNGRNLRDRDFSPTPMAGDTITGGADKFYEFLTKEVVPYIEKKYPANGQRSLVGSSFSGLFSVFAFLKDPSFFQSFVASDPNIIWDNSYVTRIAPKTLQSLPPDPGTLYIAGLTRTHMYMGISGFDSVLKANAPSSLHWKVALYPEESHYSVQLKAFYDAARFSHYGYFRTPPEFHPMAGTINSTKPFTVYFLNENPTARFTTDGSTPDTTSRKMVRDESTTINVPDTLSVKTFPYRKKYLDEVTAIYTRGIIKGTTSKKLKAGLTYKIYKGSFDSIPSTISTAPARTGTVDSSFALSSVGGNDSSIIVIEGALNIPKETEYVFFINNYAATELSVSGKSLFKVLDGKKHPSQSYVATLATGLHAFRLTILKNPGEQGPNFTIFQLKPDSEKWWENAWKNF